MNVFAFDCPLVLVLDLISFPSSFLFDCASNEFHSKMLSLHLNTFKYLELFLKAKFVPFIPFLAFIQEFHMVFMFKDTQRAFDVSVQCC